MLSSSIVNKDTNLVNADACWMMLWDEGKGLTLMVATLEGDHTQRHHDAETARTAILNVMKKEKAKGFAEVIVARNTLDGVGYL